jgi:hypothetical protein
MHSHRLMSEYGDFSPTGFIQAYILTVDSEYKELIEAGVRMAKESRKMVCASRRSLEQIKRDQKSLKDEIDSIRESLRHQDGIKAGGVGWSRPNGAVYAKGLKFLL